MYKHLLVPLDGSNIAEKALEPAYVIAEAMNARITLLSVSIRFSDTSLHNPKLDKQADDRARTYLGEVTSRAGVRSFPLDIATAMGVPSEEIVRSATDLGVDLIVMATHGETGDPEARLGSTAWKVLHDADSPVLLVRVMPKASSQVA